MTNFTYSINNKQFLCRQNVRKHLTPLLQNTLGGLTKLIGESTILKEVTLITLELIINVRYHIT